VAGESLSFAAQVKDELSHEIPALDCCRRMELAGLLRASGRLELGGPGRLAVVFSTDHAPVARKILKLMRLTFGLQTVTMVTRRRRLRKNLAYAVRVPPQPGLPEMLRATGIIDEEGSLLEWADLPELEADHCRRAYLRGTFLGSGWVAPPERQHHLEMATASTEAADAIGQMLFGYGINIRVAARKELLILYLKDAGHVTRFLGLVGATDSLLHYEDVRAMKDMKNLVNRQVNAETANLNKTVEAAARQVEALERFLSLGGFARLPGTLRELAALRINHPEASLKELGELCNPPLSKSAVNHRMRQLMQVASREPQSL